MEPIEYTLSGAGLMPSFAAPPQPRTATARESDVQPSTASAMPPYRTPYRPGKVQGGLGQTQRSGSSNPESIMAMLAAGVATDASALPLRSLQRLPSAGAALRGAVDTAQALSSPGQSLAQDVAAVDGVSVAHVLRLEQEMRAALKQKRTVYEVRLRVCLLYTSPSPRDS